MNKTKLTINKTLKIIILTKINKPNAKNKPKELPIMVTYQLCKP